MCPTKVSFSKEGIRLIRPLTRKTSSALILIRVSSGSFVFLRGSFPSVSEKSDPRNHTKKERREKRQKFKSLWPGVCRNNVFDRELELLCAPSVFSVTPW